MATTFDRAIADAPVRPLQWAITIVCMAVLLCDGIDMQMLGLVAPLIIAEWGIDRGTFGPAMSAALVGMALGAWLGGWMGDRFGRRHAITLSALGFGLATIAAASADSVWEMTLWRVIGGLGFGSAFPNALPLVSEWLPERWRPYAITTLSIGTPGGGFLAAAITPYVLDDGTWRDVFLFFGIATLALVVLSHFVLRDSPPYHFAKGRPDLAKLAAARVVGGGMEIVGEEVETDERGAPARQIGVFDRSNLRLNLGIAFGFGASTLVAYGVLNWATSFLTVAGFTMEQALHASAVLGLTSVAGAISAGFLARRFGTRAVMLGVSIGVTTCLVALGVVLEVMPAQPTLAWRVVADILAGAVQAVVSCGIATVYVIMTLGYPQSCRSTGIGFGMLMGRIGGIISSFFGGMLIDFGGGSLAVYFVCLSLGGALIACVALVVDRHMPPARPA